VRRNGDFADPVATLPLTIKITDNLTLNETERRIPVGSTFVLRASSTSVGTIKFTSSDPKSVSVTPVGGRTNEATVKAVKETNGWITISVVQEIQGQTLSAQCRIWVIAAVSEATIEGVTTIVRGTNSNLRLVFAGTTPNYTSDEIQWIIKNKNGVNGSSVIRLTPDANPLQATVQGLGAGEAEVAVVTNDSVQSEIAVVTIKVVSAPTRIKVSEPEVVTYLPDKTYQLSYTIEPEGYVDSAQVVQWQSLRPTVATVDQNGLVTFVSTGEVEIKVSIPGATELADYCQMIIENPATGITLAPTNTTMRVGDTLTIAPTLAPDNVTNKTLSWSSIAPNVASVDRNGVVRALSPGSTVITCQTSNGLQTQCVIMVMKPVARIDLNYQEMMVKKGAVFYIAANVQPTDANDRTVTWSVSDSDIISVEADGTVTALSVGGATITAGWAAAIALFIVEATAMKWGRPGVGVPATVGFATMGVTVGWGFIEPWVWGRKR
jgi:uncharacterized protein YjdB